MSEFVNETVPSLHALHKLILDGDLTDAARMCDKLAAQQAVPTLPEGWVPCVITYEGQHPEEIAYGPQIMMDRLKKWLDRYFEMRTHPTQQGLDAQVLNFINDKRIALTPEYEGPWKAEVFGDEAEPVITTEGNTVRDAVSAAIAAQAKQAD